MECIVAFSFEGNRTARFNVYGWILSLETNCRIPSSKIVSNLRVTCQMYVIRL